MRTPRVFVRIAAPLHVDDAVELPEETAHHLTRVLRLRENDPLRIFNGDGDEWAATLLLGPKKTCRTRIGAALPATPRPLPVHIGMVLIKGDALDRSIQKCVELGVASIQLLYSDYCSVRRDGAQESRRHAHLERIIIAACEQSGARFLPKLSSGLPVDEFVSTHGETRPHQFVVLDPSGALFPESLPRSPTTLMIGPEGGWSAAELERFRHADMAVVRLGTQILRAETAPLAALAALKQGWRWVD